MIKDRINSGHIGWGWLYFFVLSYTPIFPMMYFTSKLSNIDLFIFSLSWAAMSFIVVCVTYENRY